MYNGDEWADYRLGDVYYSNKYDNVYNPSYEYNILYHKHKFIGSIANEYINKNNDVQKNKPLLQEIINARVTDNNTYPDTLFLHIRVGDVLCTNDFSWLSGKKDGKKFYSKVGDVSWWNEILDYIKKNKITKIIIVSGVHKNECLTESAKYIKDRARFFKKSNLKVEYQLGQSPDKDILMCYHVKHFITTGGGYGNLIKEIKTL